MFLHYRFPHNHHQHFRVTFIYLSKRVHLSTYLVLQFGLELFTEESSGARETGSTRKDGFRKGWRPHLQKLWEHFTYDASIKKTICNSCFAVLTGRKASVCKRHLFSKHKELYDEVDGKQLSALVRGKRYYD
jgi:hypothetical protein